MVTITHVHVPDEVNEDSPKSTPSETADRNTDSIIIQTDEDKAPHSPLPNSVTDIMSSSRMVNTFVQWHYRQNKEQGRSPTVCPGKETAPAAGIVNQSSQAVGFVNSMIGFPISAGDARHPATPANRQNEYGKFPTEKWNGFNDNRFASPPPPFHPGGRKMNGYMDTCSKLMWCICLWWTCCNRTFRQNQRCKNKSRQLSKFRHPTPKYPDHGLHHTRPPDTITFLQHVLPDGSSAKAYNLRQPDTWLHSPDTRVRRLSAGSC